MKDATRAEAIEWCKANGCDFVTPIFPPPEGWLWAECGEGLCLTPIFTMTDQGEELYLAEVQNA
jgi:hypothetical protein